MTAEDVMMARECLRECLQGMHEWYETAFFPISIRTTSDAVLQSLLTSEKRAAAFDGGWPATYQGAVSPAEAPKVEAGGPWALLRLPRLRQGKPRTDPTSLLLSE